MRSYHHAAVCIAARIRRIAGRLGCAGFVMAIGLTGCEPEAPRTRVSLTKPPAPSQPIHPAGSSPTLRVAVASVLTPRSTLIHYGGLVEYLGEQVGMSTEIVQRPNYAEANELMRTRFCLIGLVCNYAFLRARRQFGAEMLAAPIIAGRPDYQGYIIVARDGPYRSLADLEGRRFAFADPLCNAGWLFPRYRLKQLGLPLDGFFSGETFTYDYQRSIQAVANGLADAAGVQGPLYDWLIAQGDSDATRTRIVDRSPPVGTPPVVVLPGMDPYLRERVRAFFLTLQDSERGRELLSGIMVERFVEPDPGLYAPVQEMADALERH